MILSSFDGSEGIQQYQSNTKWFGTEKKIMMMMSHFTRYSLLMWKCGLLISVIFADFYAEKEEYLRKK